MNQVSVRGIEIMREIDPVVLAVYDEHVKAKLWMPTELLPKEFKASQLPPAIKAMLILNLLTEDGLPYFFGLLIKHLGDESAIWKWIQRWTMEEARHGDVIGIYLREVLSTKECLALDHLKKDYLLEGFWPDWGGDPIKLLAYVVLQEKATMMSHHGIARLAKKHDAVLASMMRRVSADEYRHHMAYFAMFKAAMLADADHALMALLFVIRSFAMPGNGINGFRSLSEIQSRSGVFGPAELASIAEEVTEWLGVANLSGLRPEGEKAREAIFASIKTLQRLAGRKRIPETFSLPGFGEEFVIKM